MKWAPILAFIVLALYTSINYQEPKTIVVRIPEYRSTYDLQPRHKYTVPDSQVLANMDHLANTIILPLKERFDKINLTSFCRDWKKGSAHVFGQAIDIDLDNISGYCFNNHDIYVWARDNLYFDQIIVYGSEETPTHIHISSGCKGEVYLATRWRRRTYYKRLN